LQPSGVGDRHTLQDDFDDLEPWGYGEGLEAPVGVYVINVGLPLLVIGVLVVAWLRRRARAARADAAEAQAASTLPSSGEAVVAGTVRDVEGADVAVRVTVEQYGYERKRKNQWTTTWSEVRRRTEARPFSLELPDGSRLRVEPGESPRLVDELGSWRRVPKRSSSDDPMRIATAELEQGERVYAIGMLGTGVDPRAGYRGAESRVLRPPKEDPMRLSTQSFAEPYREEARRFARWALGLAILTLVLQAAAIQYHVALLLGEQRTATVEERWLEKGGKKSNDEHYVSYRMAATSELVVDRIESEDWDRLAPGTVVPVHVSPLQTTLGPHATITGIIPILSTVALVIVSCIALSSAFRRRAWHERRLIQHREGRLDDD
jgi:hypothetical protein